MEVFHQSIQPIIKFHRTIQKGGSSLGDVYQTFSAFSEGVGKNLLSYSFERSIENYVGNFSITLKEEYSSKNMFLDEVNLLDVVEISEDGVNTDFLGIVTDITFAATGGSNTNKQISINGKSIECLFDMYTISLDQTAMAFLNTFVQKTSKENQLIDALLNVWDATNSVSVKSVINQVWKSFTSTVNDYPKISSLKIKQLINYYYGETLDWIKVNNDLEFNYPISSALYNEDTSSVMKYIRKLLPQEVYEMYGTISDNKPCLIIRENPFTFDTFKDLSNKTCTQIKPSLITDYTFTRNNNEVYTAFLSYIEGGPITPDFYQKVTASTEGYKSAMADDDKIALYGYKPKITNFIGYFSPPTDDDSEDSDSGNNKDSIGKKFIALNKKLKEWYSNLDDMYNGDVNIVNVISEQKPKIGEVCAIGKCQFYVTKEKHSWRYGQGCTINYSLSRGGDYTGTSFKRITNISAAYSELLQVSDNKEEK